MKCLIVDDEHIARNILSDYVSKVPDLELVAACSSAPEALRHIKIDPVDVLFRDIQIPDLAGLHFLNLLPHKPGTVLTTAYADYAAQRYELATSI